jgi:hypothetical protein
LAESAPQTHYVSPSGKKWTAKQKRAYYATKGFKKPIRKKRK